MCLATLAANEAHLKNHANDDKQGSTAPTTAPITPATPVPAPVPAPAPAPVPACFSADFTTGNTDTASTGLSGIPYAATGAGNAIIKWDKAANTYSMQSRITQLTETPSTNTEVIAYHLHAGDASMNGAVSVVFCMTSPLPTPDLGQNTVCPQTLTADITNGKYLQPIADATNPSTTVPKTLSTSTTMLASGNAPQSQEVFNKALEDCTLSDCNVYFNMHTKYSFAANGGKALGLSRAQLVPVACPA